MRKYLVASAAVVGLFLLGVALSKADVRHPDEWPPCGPPLVCSAAR